MSITSTIKSIQDIMRKDVGVDGDAQRLSQLVWMLFLKIFDDRESEWELLQDDYRSPLPESYRWRNWAADAEGMTGDALKQFVDNELFPALQQLPAKGGDQRAYVVRSVFEDAYNYMKSGQLLRQVINKIQAGVDFNKSHERHLFGDMYEQLLRDLQAAGNAGEFYTPRAVTEFMVRMVNPRLGEKVMDPACGTGGFLTCAIEHVRRQDVNTVDDEAQLQASIQGIEKKPLPHLLCTTNMILHGIDVPNNIRHDNTLSHSLISWGPKQRVDVVVTNPPFGGMEEDGIENNFPASFRTRETADLFLVLIMQLLKSGGRAALVLPDGFLFGEASRPASRKSCWPNATCTPSCGCRTASLRPTPASRPICCSSARARRRRTSGFTNTHTRPESKATTRPSRCASKSSRPKRHGGARKPTASRAASKTNSRGKSAGRKSRPATTTSTARTHMSAHRKSTTPSCC